MNNLVQSHNRSDWARFLKEQQIFIVQWKYYWVGQTRLQLNSARIIFNIPTDNCVPAVRIALQTHVSLRPVVLLVIKICLTSTQVCKIVDNHICLRTTQKFTQGCLLDNQYQKPYFEHCSVYQVWWGYVKYFLRYWAETIFHQSSP